MALYCGDRRGQPGMGPQAQKTDRILLRIAAVLIPCCLSRPVFPAPLLHLDVADRRTAVGRCSEGGY